MKTKEKKNINWTNVRIDEVLEIIDGDRGTNYPSKKELLSEGDCLFLNTKNVPDTNFDFSTAEFITAEKDCKLRKGKLQRGDFVLTTRGTVGNVAYYDDAAPYESIRINSGMVILRPDPSMVDPAFLAAFLTSALFRAHVASLVSGSAQPQLPIRDLRTISLALPPLNVQRGVGNTLQNYSTKIENNNKIIKTLEEMAQAIFKEWFVYYRFPGHEKAEFVDSEMGRVPKGWCTGKFSDIASLQKGLSYSSPEINGVDTGAPLINLANFLRGGGFNIGGTKNYTGKYKEVHKVHSGQIVIAMTDLTSNREVIGHPARVPSDMKGAVISLDVCSVVTDDVFVEYLYHLMLRKAFAHLMASSASGTNVSHLSKKCIEDHKVVIPSNQVLQLFTAVVKPMFEAQAVIERETRSLLSTRDLLLPRLISGEISV